MADLWPGLLSPRPTPAPKLFGLHPPAALESPTALAGATPVFHIPALVSLLRPDLAIIHGAFNDAGDEHALPAIELDNALQPYTGLLPPCPRGIPPGHPPQRALTQTSTDHVLVLGPHVDAVRTRAGPLAQIDFEGHPFHWKRVKHLLKLRKVGNMLWAWPCMTSPDPPPPPRMCKSVTIAGAAMPSHTPKGSLPAGTACRPAWSPHCRCRPSGSRTASGGAPWSGFACRRFVQHSSYYGHGSREAREASIEGMAPTRGNVPTTTDERWFWGWFWYNIPVLVLCATAPNAWGRQS